MKEKYPGVEIDWSTFPPAVDEGGPFYLEQFFNEFCDNARQDSYHTASGIKAAILNFVKTRPWLDKNRRCFLQSDGAVNYHEPTTEVDLYWIGTRCFSEPGEGKDWVDSNSALVKGVMRRHRNRGFFQQNAYEYFTSAESHVVIGNTNCVLEVDASKDVKIQLNICGKRRTCVPGIRNFALFNVDDENGTITFWESLDYLESEKSMAGGGPAVGFGPGLKLTLDTFNEVHRTREDNYDGTILHMGSTEKSTRAHIGKDERDEIARLKNDKKRVALEKNREREAKKDALVRCEDSGGDFACGRCGVQFMTAARLQTHTGKEKCKDKVQAAVAKFRMRSIVSVLSAKAAETKEKKQKTVERIAMVEVKFKPQEGSVKNVGVQLDLVEGSLVVKSIEEGGAAFKTAQIDEGMILVSVNGVTGVDLRCLDEVSALRDDKGKVKDVVVVFRRATPPIPVRGYARRGFKKNRRDSPSNEQKKWLEEQFRVWNPAGVRAVQYHERMKMQYPFRIRTDCDEPFWMTEIQISDWLKDKRAVIKAQKKAGWLEKKTEAKKRKMEEEKEANAKQYEVKKKSKSTNNSKQQAAKGDGNRGRVPMSGKKKESTPHDHGVDGSKRSRSCSTSPSYEKRQAPASTKQRQVRQKAVESVSEDEDSEEEEESEDDEEDEMDEE